MSRVLKVKTDLASLHFYFRLFFINFCEWFLINFLDYCISNKSIMPVASFIKPVAFDINDEQLKKFWSQVANTFIQYY